MYSRRKTPVERTILRFTHKVAPKYYKKTKSYLLDPSTRPWRGIFRHPGLLNPSTYWRFAECRHKGISLKQVNAFYVLSRVQRFHKEIGAVGIPVDGTMLGAVRSQSFAGRPADLDFFVIVKGGVERYLDLLEAAGRNYCLRPGRHKYANGSVAKIKVISDLRIDIRVSDHDPLEPGSVVEENNPIPKYGIIDWPGIDLAEKTNVHGVELFLPRNHVEILEKLYGPSWATPKGLQWGLAKE